MIKWATNAGHHRWRNTIPFPPWDVPGGYIVLPDTDKVGASQYFRTRAARNLAAYLDATLPDTTWAARLITSLCEHPPTANVPEHATFTDVAYSAAALLPPHKLRQVMLALGKQGEL